MRPVLPGDIAAAGCALLVLPARKRPGAMLEMLHRAEAADRYRRALGHAHPSWGNGSLGSVAMCLPRAAEPFLNDPDYVDCMLTVFAALKARNDRRSMPTRSRN
ncbi:hypothetical protein SAMN05444851_2116 [Aliiroseovarius sediminilitoris]|uniref:DUF7742 domain-containing protein n=1 Tax=Aliiroseovarius sediminilitoris TaxID=1173584 RepID=A0A1I0Q0Y1_9RHOB|nr:hypothetical protein [Aliiroseovarius sediminilitoris]SEW20561.1 hypothetical protein SAMN05444851_2116 [Aliiroseovarius sediminilitoris]